MVRGKCPGLPSRRFGSLPPLQSWHVWSQVSRGDAGCAVVLRRPTTGQVEPGTQSAVPVSRDTPARLRGALRLRPPPGSSDAGEADTSATKPRHPDGAPRSPYDGPKSTLGTPGHRPEIRARRTCGKTGSLACGSPSRTGPAAWRPVPLCYAGGRPRQQSEPGQSIDGIGRRKRRK